MAGKSRKFKAGATSGVRKKSDEVYNARKRFTRAAQRYEKKARQTSGTLSEKFRELARIELRNALSTYEKKPEAKAVKRLQESLGVEYETRKPSEQRREYLIKRSLETTETTITSATERREREAKALLSTNIGKRIYAGLVSVWKGADDINAAIMEKFGVDSMADVIEKIEAQVNIYADGDELERYDEIRGLIELAFA